MRPIKLPKRGHMPGSPGVRTTGVHTLASRGRADCVVTPHLATPASSWHLRALPLAPFCRQDMTIVCPTENRHIRDTEMRQYSPERIATAPERNRFAANPNRHNAVEPSMRRFLSSGIRVTGPVWRPSSLLPPPHKPNKPIFQGQWPLHSAPPLRKYAASDIFARAHVGSRRKTHPTDGKLSPIVEPCKADGRLPCSFP